ncbi:hypothetical protein E8E11_007660 [Didymella keratinophila]|nr:hypothetical protein E8E11_007660 [Didymella keratinophila]
MVSFDVFSDGGATGNDESQHYNNAPLPVVETLLEQTDNLLTESQIVDLPRRSLSRSQKGDPTSIIGPYDSNHREIVRLQWSLTDLQTAIKAKDVELGIARQELLNAKDALTKSISDISTLQNDMKTMKQTLGKDHQAIVYRKDIELFALRKGNEQKERHMQEKDIHFNETFKQQRATLELKEAQLNVLKERLAAMERQASPRFSNDAMFDPSGNGDHALEVRLLRVKKGRPSLSGTSGSASEEDKDAIIEQLRRELSAATKSADDVVNQQAELQRAWDISKKIQQALKEERERHDQTKALLQEASAELEDAQQNRRRSRSDPSPGRLPTIEENDQTELEAMFDTAQQDNLRLHMEVDALDKRVRDANSRVFLADQEIEALREQLRLEHAINEDMETARPSVVHRVHFQRMEGQLKESRDDLAKKETELQNLRLALVGKDCQLEALRADVQAAVKKSESASYEIENLRQSVADLEAARERLMQNHERLAAQRPTQRVSSAEFTSARESGATLVNEHSPPPLTSPDDAPTVPTAPMLGSPVLGSVQQRDTSRGHQRNQSDSQRHSLVSNASVADIPNAKRRSGLGLRDMVKRMVKKDTSIDGVLRSPTIPEESWGNRPTTAVNTTAPMPMPPRMHERRASLTSHPVEQKKEVDPMPRPIPRPISGPSNAGNRPRTSTAPTASIPRRFPSRKELDEQHLQRPRTATQPVLGTHTAALPKVTRPPNPRRSSQPRYYTSSTVAATNSTEDLKLQDARPRSTATAPLASVVKGLDKQSKHDSGVGAITEGEKSKLSRLSWGNTANAPVKIGIRDGVTGDFKLVPREQAVVSVFDSNFLIGDGIWEGIRAVNGKGDLLRLIHETLDANDLKDEKHVHIRLVVSRGLKSTPYQNPNVNIGLPLIVIIPEVKAVDPSSKNRGLRLATTWVRRGPPDVKDEQWNHISKATDVQACISANVMHVDEALMLDLRGFVKTCNSVNFFIVRGEEVWAPTKDNQMQGITRQKTIDVCRANGIPVREMDFTLTEVYGADEAFCTGTFPSQIHVTENALGYTAVLGIKEDAHLKNQEYSWLGSIFYFGYLAMEFPTLWLVTRFPVGKYVGVFGGILSYGIGKIRGALSTWKYIFLIYGAFTFLFGILFFFAMPDSPSTAWFFNADEKKLAAIRLAPNQTGIESRKKFQRKQIWEAFRDPKCYMIWLSALGYAVANAGITNFNPLIISGYGFGKTKTLLMATPQAAVAMVASASLTAVSMYVPKVRCFFWIFGATMGLIGAVMVHTLHSPETRNASLAGVYLMGFYNVPWVFTLSLSSSNTGGATKKSFMGITCAVMYAVGNIIGPQFFISSQSPTYPLGIGAMLVAFALMAVTGTVYYALGIFENKRRDRLYGLAQDEAAVGLQAERDDLTDRQNVNFRYTY